MHAADAQVVFLFDDVGIDFELTAVTAQAFAIGFIIDVWFLFGFEIEDFNGIALATDEVDFTFEDIILFLQGDGNLVITNRRPVATGAIYIAINVTFDGFQAIFVEI